MTQGIGPIDTTTPFTMLWLSKYFWSVEHIDR